MTEIVVLNDPDAAATPAASTQEGKFLQLVLRGKEYLVFAPKSLHRYHNQILAHFLSDRAIPHEWIAEQELKVFEPDVQVMGGGRFRADFENATLDLWDNSQAYGRFDDRDLAAGIAQADHPWNRLSVHIVA